MGDAFDSRKGIEFKSLKWSKRVVFNPLKERGIKMHLMVGNHDAYYKNTNEINAVDLLLKEYDNVEVYSSPTEVSVGDLPVLFIPWINEQNEKETNDICRAPAGALQISERQSVQSQWDTLNSTDSSRPLVTSWSTVMTQEPLISSRKSFRDIITLDPTMEPCSILVIPMKCSGMMSKVPEVSLFLILSPWNIDP